MGTKKGLTKYIKTPKDFLKLWDDYKGYVDEDPYNDSVLSNKGDIKTISRKKPYLRQGFESWAYRELGHHIHQYIDNHNNAYEDYLGVVTCARMEWETDQISGSLTGQYKAPHLVARLNGLSDKQEVKQETTIRDLTIEVIDTNVPLAEAEKDIED
jgi:hypothetical protein